MRTKKNYDTDINVGVIFVLKCLLLHSNKEIFESDFDEMCEFVFKLQNVKGLTLLVPANLTVLDLLLAMLPDPSPIFFEAFFEILLHPEHQPPPKDAQLQPEAQTASLPEPLQGIQPLFPETGKLHFSTKSR